MVETRASKKQYELFVFIQEFIAQHGYGPSYREVMSALDYKSVSTVAIHIDGLIAKGFLRKKDRSARSLEVVEQSSQQHTKVSSEHILWIRSHIKKRRAQATPQSVKEADVLEQALAIINND